ncbi:MAG: carboxypeptidase-like regulatory domain-containing protein [Fibrobacter sp.]|nr:carboxypeptidase-like regulatory domain-containing protein [Fibrobacter sp.]
MSIRRLIVFLSVVFFAVVAFGATPTLISGVVLEAENDLPIKDVTITYVSGKSVGETNSDGRFEYTVSSSNASLVFKKDGFDSVVVELQDFADLFDMVVTLSTNVRSLGASTIVGGSAEKVQWEVERKINLDKLEDAAGMRFDLTEHLSQMPGISGQKDFSSALYYDGSRAGDVAYHLGRLRIPNMRHLDVGFPGNLSVINPHTLSGIEIHDNYGEGPIGQGLATSVQYIPEQTKGDWGLRGTAGITMREVVVDVPWLFWDSFRFAFRMLDADMLKNMGEKFFSEFRKNTDDCKDCKVAESNPYDLSAMDVYAQFNGSDSEGNTWALRTLYSSDEYSVHQDTSRRIDSVAFIDIIEGVQSYLVIGAEYESRFGTSFHAGMVREHVGDTLRDTIGFRSPGSTDQDMAKAFIDSYEQTHTTLSGGLDKKFKGDIYGSKLSGALLYEHHVLEHKYPEFGGVQSKDHQTGVLSGAGRLNWKSDYSQKILSLGAVADAGEHEAAPTASFDYQQNLSKTDTAFWRLFGNAAYRSDWKPYFDDGELTGRLESGVSAKLGLGYNSKYFIAQASGFGRYYADPLLPLPKAYARYNDVTPVDFAWVAGASGSAELKTSHHFSMATNISSVYGEYELDGGRSLPWEANSRLDILSHFRYYPRKDSIVSVILTHHAALHRPLYYYSITPATANSIGTRELKDYHQFTDFFRTDLRVNLDLIPKKSFFRTARFYLELDNIFANLDVEFLGSDNYRERSYVTRDDRKKNSADGYDLVPFMAKGLGLYPQFGVEVQF